MTHVSKFIEERQNDILDSNYKLHMDTDSGITWYEDDDLDKAYDQAIDEIEEELESEIGVISLVILKNEKFVMQRIKNIDKFNKKDVAAIIQKDKIVYTSGYFRIYFSD